MSYRTVRTRAHDARSALVSLWASNLPIAESACEAKYRWFYEQAPSGPGDAFLLHTDEGPDAGRAIGCAGIGARLFLHRGAQVRAALLVDLAVDKRHRSGFPALSLQRAVKKLAKSEHDFTYGFPNALAVAVHLRLGFRELGKMPRYTRVFHHAPYVRRSVDIPVVSDAAGVALDVATTALDLARSARARMGRTLDWSPTIDGRFDRLWANAKPMAPLTGRRDAAFVEWRHARHPHGAHRIVAMSKRWSTELLGWVALGTRDNRVHVTDFFAKDAGELDHLVALLLPALRRRGFSTVSVSFLGAPVVRAVFERRGFAQREVTRTVIFDAGESGAIPPAVLGDEAMWYLTDADEDI